MAYLLHIDTSGDNGIVAVSHNGSVISSINNADTRNHAATINLHIGQVLQQAGISMQQLDAVAVCGGPGSYTGLRISLATAKGLCYILDKPLMMHNKLTLLCLGAFYEYLIKYDCYATIMQARDKEYYFASYNNKLEIIDAPCHLMEEDLVSAANKLNGKILLTADINEAINKIFSSPDNLLVTKTVVEIDAWARYANEQYNCNAFVNLPSAEPFYLKPVYTHKPKNIS